MTLNSIIPPWKIDPARFVYGLLPEGTRSGASIATRIDELLPDGWPKRPTWIVAVRTNDGRRIVFGRDDVTGTVGQATQASSAIPAFYTPVRIGDRSYVDGALHSSTNADLVATLGFDLVIVSSVKTATADARSWRSDPERAWFSNKLDNELAEIRSTGTPAIVIEPDDTQLELLASGERADACLAGRLAAERVLATNEGAGLQRSSNRPAESAAAARRRAVRNRGVDHLEVHVGVRGLGGELVDLGHKGQDPATGPDHRVGCDYLVADPDLQPAEVKDLELPTRSTGGLDHDEVVGVIAVVRVAASPGHCAVDRCHHRLVDTGDDVGGGSSLSPGPRRRVVQSSRSTTSSWNAPS